MWPRYAAAAGFICRLAFLQTSLSRLAHPLVALIRVRTLASTLLVLLLFGCASVANREAAPDDPLEPANRAALDINLALDDAIFQPFAKAYRTIVPSFARDRIRAAIDNLAEPRIWVNDILQGRINDAGITFTRFLLNSTGGLGGMFDLATERGLPRQTGDFGQTLFTWGFPDGPYLVLLFFGPSNLRDAFGLGVDIVTTPPALVVAGHTGTVVGLTVGTIDGLDLRARNIETLDEIKASAIDLYARLKSLTRQQREAQLRQGRGQTVEPEELVDPEAVEKTPKP
jgi:phospholipid-binding lipoprotein MlaA